VAPHHTVVLSAGLTVVNSNYNQAYFGVSPTEARNSINPIYRASGGVKDLHAGVRWNWAMSPAWLLTSGLGVSHLSGSAARSPLVERRTSLSASTVLAYRF
jgi:outer membrane protein